MKKLTVSLYVGETPIQTLTEAQKNTMSERLSKRLSEFYSAHSQEYSILITNEVKKK